MAFFGFPHYTGHFGGFHGAPLSAGFHTPTHFGPVMHFGQPVAAAPTQAPAYVPGQDVGAKLTYFAGRGLAEGIRYALALGRVPWTEEHITSREQWEALKATGKLPFDQVPLLEFRGGHLVQSGATIRAIGRHCNLYGTTPAEAYRIDSLLDAAQDVVEPITKLAFVGRTPEALDAALTKFRKKVAIFERLFEHHEDTGRPWVFLARATPTVADSQLAMALRWSIEELGEPAAQCVAESPLVARFLEAFEALPQIQAYLTGPQRPPLPDAALVATVREILQF